jgi:hypothetical protein
MVGVADSPIKKQQSNRLANRKEGIDDFIIGASMFRWTEDIIRNYKPLIIFI